MRERDLAHKNRNEIYIYISKIPTYANPATDVTGRRKGHKADGLKE